MNVRYATAADEPRLREIYSRMCMPYDYPDVTAPEFVAKLVVVDENDTPVVAGLARKTVEIYGLIDPSWETPAWRFEALTLLHEAMRHEVGRQGYKEACAWIPPNLVKSFARKLKHVFGWKAADWPCYYRKTGY